VVPLLQFECVGVLQVWAVAELAEMGAGFATERHHARGARTHATAGCATIAHIRRQHIRVASRPLRQQRGRSTREIIPRARARVTDAALSLVNLNSNSCALL